MSLLGNIVNTKHRNDGEAEQNIVNLYRYIEEYNSNDQNIMVIDPCDSNRVKWLKKHIYEQHFKQWEKVLIEEGFGREPIDDNEQKLHGNVIFHNGPDSIEYVNLDEVKITFDQGSENAGGQPACTPSNPKLPDPSTSGNKSDLGFTAVMCCIGNKAAPPLLIFPTHAKKEVHVKAKMFESFKQIHGKYGYSQARYFDPYIAYGPKGSMTGEIFESYMAFIASLFPYLADTPGS